MNEHLSLLMSLNSLSAILSSYTNACLLRSGQKGVGELLRHSLELVLEFTIVVSEFMSGLHRGD